MTTNAMTKNKLTPRLNKWYGWRPDLPDHRDHCLSLGHWKSKRRIMGDGPLPRSIDLSDGIGPCYDQGNLGSCTANAIAALIEFEQKVNGLPVFTPSRLQIYYGERALEGSIKEDAGAEIRDGIKVVAKQGAAPETLWPYQISKFAKKPPIKVMNAAKKHLAIEYARLPQNADDILNCLAYRTPFVFGFTVYESFESHAITLTGRLEMPGTTEKSLGGHAVVAMGYLDPKTILVRNSWGQQWGLPSHDGYFTMPIDYLLNPNLADDLWAIRLVQ